SSKEQLFMKYLRRSMDRFLSLIVILGAASTSTTYAVMQPAEVVIQEITGAASYSVAGTWQPLKKNMRLTQGSVIKTEANSTVDLLFHASATAIRLTPDSSLRLDRLSQEPGGETLVSDP